MNPQEAFLNMLFAAMMDAAVERKLTQLQTTISPDGNAQNIKKVRIVVIPDELDHTWPTSHPLGSAGAG